MAQQFLDRLDILAGFQQRVRRSVRRVAGFVVLESRTAHRVMTTVSAKARMCRRKGPEKPLRREESS